MSAQEGNDYQWYQDTKPLVFQQGKTREGREKEWDGQNPKDRKREKNTQKENEREMHESPKEERYKEESKKWKEARGEGCLVHA